MIKRIISMVSALAVVTGATVSARLVSETVSAPMGWGISYNGGASTTNVTYQLDEENVRSGEKSLNTGTTISTSSGGDAVVKYTLPDGAEAGSYILSFYLKGTYTDASIRAGVTSALGRNDNLQRGFSASNDSDGWKKYTRTVSVGGDTTHLNINILSGCESVYIDDISLKKGDVELIENGGFELMDEKTTTTIVTDAPNPDPSESGLDVVKSDYYPENVMGIESESDITLSWINPVKPLSNVSLYEIIGDYESEIETNMGTTSSALSKYSVPKDSGNRNFKLRFTFNDGTISEYVIGSNTASKAEIPEWEIGVKGLFSSWLDVTDKHGADASFKMQSNENLTAGGQSLVLSQPLKLEASTDYIVYLWRKSNGASADNKVKYGDKILSGEVIAEKDGWENVTYRFSSGDVTTGTLAFEFIKNTKSINLDDIELYKLENGSPTGENLVSNGDFESEVVISSVAPVTNPAGTAKEKGATLTWSNPGETVVVYRKTDSGYVKCGELGKTAEIISFSNLEAEKLYDFAIVTQDAELNDSRASLISVTPLPPEVEIGELDVTKNSSGVLSIKRNIENNRIEDGYKVELIAVLVENGVITKIASGGSVTVPVDEPMPVKVELDVSGAAVGSNVLLYTWDELFGLGIRTACETAYVVE